MLRSLSIPEAKKFNLITGLLLGCISLTSNFALSMERIGLVLSGGGARGFAHIAVLEAIEKAKVPIHLIVGSSMGAVVGALYASGLSAEEVRTRLLKIDWGGTLKDLTDRNEKQFRSKQYEEKNLLGIDVGIGLDGLKLPLALIHGQKLALAMNQLTLDTVSVGSFDELPIPFRAVATDLATGDPVVLKDGALATALRASMAMPAVFAPVEKGNRLLVDGGVANNLPVDVARDLGAEKLIVVDVSSQKYGTNEISSLVTVVDQLTNLLTRRNTEKQLADLTENDLLFEIYSPNVRTNDFHLAALALANGRKYLQEQAGALDKFSVDNDKYKEWLISQRTGSVSSTLSFVEVRSDAPRTSSKSIANKLTLRPGQTLDNERLSKDLKKIYALETIERIEVSTEPRDEGVGLILSTREKSWGPNYLDLGIGLEDSLDGHSDYSLTGVLKSTNINPLGGEWRTTISLGKRFGLETEFFQPVDYGSDWFASAMAGILREDKALYESGKIEAIHGSELRYTDFAVGKNFSTKGEIRAGVRAADTRYSLLLGEGTLNSKVVDSHSFVRVGYDTLDNIGFPTRGIRFVGKYLAYGEDVLKDFDYDGIELDILAPMWTSDDSTLVFQGFFGTSFETDVSKIVPGYRLGGLTRLSGYGSDEIVGRHSGLLSFIGYKKLTNENASPFDQPIFVGGSLERGNIYQDRRNISWKNSLSAGSVFFGADTVVGPAFLAFGRSEDNRQSVTLSVGRPFLVRN